MKSSFQVLRLFSFLVLCFVFSEAKASALNIGKLQNSMQDTIPTEAEPILIEEVELEEIDIKADNYFGHDLPVPPPEGADDSQEVYTVVEQFPVFPGGEAMMLKYVATNLKFPATETNVKGTVYVQFVVEKNGSITNVRVVRGLQEAFNNEAIRVIKSMPNWHPGYQNGRAVRVSYTMPIRFETNK